MHLPSDFWSCPLPAIFNQPIRFCPICLNQTEDNSCKGENPEPSVNKKQLVGLVNATKIFLPYVAI